MNAVSIANGGLLRVGSSVRITSLDETVERTEAVRQSGFWYPIIRDKILETAPWGFARKSVALAQVTDTTFPGWNYIYEYPSDCIHACAVCDAGGMRSPGDWFGTYPWANPRFASQVQATKIPFQIGTRADGNSSVIMTDIPSAYLFYIFRQTITATFSQLFVDTFMWAMGADVGASLQVKQERVQNAASMYERTLLRAMTQMMNEAQQDQEQDSPSILVRG
jgi:hypothetical protein